MRFAVILVFCVLTVGCASSKETPQTTRYVVKKEHLFDNFTKNIKFKSGTDELKNSYSQEFQDLVKLMKELDGWNYYIFNINGHTDSVGAMELNRILSKKRADKIRRILIEKGVDSTYIRTYGYGEEFPISTNKTREGRELNRRIEIKAVPR